MRPWELTGVATVASDPARRFPVLWQGSRELMQELDQLGCPRSVPWSLVEPHARQAHANHGQSLETLAARHGLSPLELIAVLTDVPFRKVRALGGDAAAVPVLKRFIEEHESKAAAASGPKLRVYTEAPEPILDQQSGVPHCTDACRHYDGKRCGLMGLRPRSICEPAVAEMAAELAELRASGGGR